LLRMATQPWAWAFEKVTIASMVTSRTLIMCFDEWIK
jgi:hypothetical protein